MSQVVYFIRLIEKDSCMDYFTTNLRHDVLTNSYKFKPFYMDHTKLYSGNKYIIREVSVHSNFVSRIVEVEFEHLQSFLQNTNFTSSAIPLVIEGYRKENP